MTSWVASGGDLILANPVEEKYPFKMKKRQVQVLKNTKGERTGYTFTERNPSDLASQDVASQPGRVWIMDSLFQHLPKKSDVSNTRTLEGGMGSPEKLRASVKSTRNP